MKQLSSQPKRANTHVNSTNIVEIKREQQESNINIAGVRQQGETTTIDRSERREILRPFRDQRLGFEGVLIDIIEPNKRNKYTYGLVFGSLYAPEEQIELDHAVIRMSRGEFHTLELQRFVRYYFTTNIGKYYKKAHILGIPVNQEHFMLESINSQKMIQIETSNLTQPTIYTLNRIQNVLQSKVIEPEHTERELLDIVTQLPNDGKVELFIDQYTNRYRNVSMSKHDMFDALYSDD